MVLLDALREISKDENSYVVRSDYEYGIRYKHSGNLSKFQTCDKYGNFKKNVDVTLNLSELLSVNWEVKRRSDPKYEVGQRLMLKNPSAHFDINGMISINFHSTKPIVFVITHERSERNDSDTRNFIYSLSVDMHPNDKTRYRDFVNDLYIENISEEWIDDNLIATIEGCENYETD